MNKELFVTTINALRDQNDIEVSRSKKLSEIYGSDIDPNDNSILTDAIFKILDDFFGHTGLIAIGHFCFEQDYGRVVLKDAGMLWEELIKDIDVVL